MGGAGLATFDSDDVEPEKWLVVEAALGALWLSGALITGAELGALVCEALALDEELGAELVETLAGALGAGAGAGLGAGLGAALGGGLGGGLLGALDS